MKGGTLYGIMYLFMYEGLAKEVGEREGGSARVLYFFSPIRRTPYLERVCTTYSVCTRVLDTSHVKPQTRSNMSSSDNKKTLFED